MSMMSTTLPLPPLLSLTTTTTEKRQNSAACMHTRISLSLSLLRSLHDTWVRGKEGTKERRLRMSVFEERKDSSLLSFLETFLFEHAAQ